jgi:hypothetical protein
VGGVWSFENAQSGRRRPWLGGRQHGREALARASRTALRSRRPQTRLDTFCTRTGRPPRRPDWSGPTGEGLGRTARMHVSEESDSGVVPMNHSNEGGPPLAESAEGRPLVKENTHPPPTRPTQSGARVSLGLMGVRSAEHRFTATYPRQEPAALISARTDLRGGYRVTGIPTATDQCFSDRGLFSCLIRQRQAVNLDGTRRYRCPVQSKFAVTRPPPEEPTVRTALTVATPPHQPLPCGIELFLPATASSSREEPTVKTALTVATRCRLQSRVSQRIKSRDTSLQGCT